MNNAVLGISVESALIRAGLYDAWSRLDAIGTATTEMAKNILCAVAVGLDEIETER